MKTSGASLIAAVILAAATSSPALANGVGETVQLGSGSSCLPNSIRCKQGYRQGHPRCFTAAVRDRNGAIRKRRVCVYPGY